MEYLYRDRKNIALFRNEISDV